MQTDKSRMSEVPPAVAEHTAMLPRALMNASGLFFLAQISAKGLNFLFFVLLTRWLSVDHFGILTFAVAIALIVDILADLGMSRLVLREVARRPALASRRLGLVLPLKAGLGVAIYLPVMGIVLANAPERPTIGVFAIVGVSMVIAGAALLCEQVLHALGRFGTSALAHIALSLVQLGAAVWFHAAGGGTLWIAFALVLANAAYLCVILLGLRAAGVRPALRLVPKLWRTVLRRSAPYGMVGVLVIIGQRVEFLLVGQLLDINTLGQFGAAARIYDAAMIAPLTLCTVLAPRLVAAQMQSSEAVTALYGKGVRAMLAVGMFVALLGIALAHQTVSLLLPSDYAGSGDILWIMAIGYPFTCVALLNLSLMLGLGSQRRPTLMMAALVCVQIAIGIVACRLGGGTGAAVAMALSAALACAVSSAAARFWVLDQPIMARAALPAVAATVLALILHEGLWFMDQPWRLAISAAAFVALTGAIWLMLPLAPVRIGGPDHNLRAFWHKSAGNRELCEKIDRSK